MRLIWNFSFKNPFIFSCVAHIHICLTFRSPHTFPNFEVIAKEAVFWNAHFEAIQTLSLALKEAIVPGIPASFSPVIPSQQLAVRVTTHFTYVDDMDMVIALSEKEAMDKRNSDTCYI